MLAGIVDLAYGSQVVSRPTIASKSYAAVFVGAHLVELHLEPSRQAIRLDFHVANAVPLLQQVRRMFGISAWEI